jgi:hypothetical protein
MSPLRRRMIEDMSMRRLAPKTQKDYIQVIKNLAVFIGRSPHDLLRIEDAACGAHGSGRTAQNSFATKSAMSGRSARRLSIRTVEGTQTVCEFSVGSSARG